LKATSREKEAKGLRYDKYRNKHHHLEVKATLFEKIGID